MKQIDIKELIPKMKPGYVACNENGSWIYSKYKPHLIYDSWIPECRWKSCDARYLDSVFNIAPAKDWTKSLMKVGEK